MPPAKRAGSSSGPSRSTTGTAPKGSVRVWGEVSITVCITEDPPQFVKVTFGHERMCPDDDESIVRTERKINRKNEEVVERRAQELARLVRSASES